jgi:F0F1-type ATP synthase membrane subunit b/b'
MDMVLGIFTSLGADKTLWIQLSIAIVMLFVSNFLFLNHLQIIIEKREKNTTGLEGEADSKFEEVDRLAAEYKEKISSATKAEREKIEIEKSVITKNLESKYRTEEKSVNDHVDKSRKESEAKVAAQKDEVLSGAEELAMSLVQKITKG